MDSKVNLAMQLFKEGHNCTQAVICTYCEDFNISKEDAYRLSEGFGGGIAGIKTICGAASGMVMLAGLKNSPRRDMNNITKKKTYHCVENLNKQFVDRMGYLTCTDLLAHNDCRRINGKPAGCLACVKCACEIIEETLYGN